ncbi:elongator complex protein 3 [Candidatus Clostridium stratigraminis]|uniref:Elongator complex protein 3 n=1 Tax=Candidatus Clostridium stratigraminis TaxID=3381661 RepID=A0ABW8T7C6_9CLOT
MNKARYIIPIFVPHEGCPHDCVFCNQNSITGTTTKVNAKFVKTTVEEYLKTLPEENRILEISFFGGTFTAINIEKQKELLEVAKFYKDRGVIDYIRLSTRPDYIDSHILANLKDYSVDIIELGVQSMDKEVLIKSARGHSSEDVIKASLLIKAYGFTLGHQIMLGLPGDSFKKDIDTTAEIIKLSPDLCRIYPALVIKDTPMEKMYYSNIYKPYTLEEAIKISKVIYVMLLSNNINVIRIGLQPTEEINVGKDIIAGPFHPSFRELVEGSIFNDLILEAAPKNYTGDYEITVNDKDISKLFCNKKTFFNDTKEQLKTLNIKLTQSKNINRGELELAYFDQCHKVSISEFLTKKYKEGYLNLL